jgi:hypothetical protein
MAQECALMPSNVFRSDRYMNAAMGFPSSPSSKIRSRNDISAISSLLSTLHSGHFLIWSAAEEQVDASAFEDQVIEVNFPGYPAPPLGLLFKICTSIENWLAADSQNIAVIFCMVSTHIPISLSYMIHPNYIFVCVADWKRPHIRH